ncbi:MAG: hypothetical protein WBJ46_08365, partial [Rectinema sp.]
ASPGHGERYLVQHAMVAKRLRHFIDVDRQLGFLCMRIINVLGKGPFRAYRPPAMRGLVGKMRYQRLISGLLWPLCMKHERSCV